MSKKNKPTIIRLGIHSVKTLINQNYGKSYNLYIYNFFFQQNLHNFVNQYFTKQKSFYSYIEVLWLKNLILINLHYIKNMQYLYFIKIMNKFFFKKKICVRLYKKNITNTTSLLLSSYSDFLIKKNITIKKKLLLLIAILNKTINTYKIVYTKQGPIKLVMLGYKITLSGRVENTKNQMAKSISYNCGKISLITLNNQLDYLSTTVYTKLGTYSLSIWLYYKTI